MQWCRGRMVGAACALMVALLVSCVEAKGGSRGGGSSGSGGGKTVHVRGYYRSDGTYVQPYDRSPPRLLRRPPLWPHMTRGSLAPSQSLTLPPPAPTTSPLAGPTVYRTALLGKSSEYMMVILYRSCAMGGLSQCGSMASMRQRKSKALGLWPSTLPQAWPSRKMSQSWSMTRIATAAWSVRSSCQAVTVSMHRWSGVVWRGGISILRRKIPCCSSLSTMRVRRAGDCGVTPMRRRHGNSGNPTEG